jgi:hypothetical protein
MNEAMIRRGLAIAARADQPLIAIPVERNGQEHVYYFVDDAAASAEDIRAALAAIGSAADVDAAEMLDELERIRRASAPTPPVDLDV